MNESTFSRLEDNRMTIHGQSLIALAQEQDFVTNAYFIITGKRITPAIHEILNLLLSLCLDHGPDTISAQALRQAARDGQRLEHCLAAGLQAMGPAHGGATEDAARWLQHQLKKNVSAHDAVATALRDGVRLAGFGHRIVTEDERAVILFDALNRHGLPIDHFRYMQAVEKELAEQKGKPLPLNIDGAIAATALDVGIPAEAATGLFILGRVPGLIAHTLEAKQ